MHNTAGYAILAALAEVFTLGVSRGRSLALWQAVPGAFGRRRTFDRLAEQFLPGQFDPAAFALKLAHKDITLATELGRELNVPLRIAALVHEELTEALNRGWAERDSRIFMLLQEERAGVNIAVPATKSRKRSRAASPQRKRLVSVGFFVLFEDILNVCPPPKDAIWSNQFDNRED